MMLLGIGNMHSEQGRSPCWRRKHTQTWNAHRSSIRRYPACTYRCFVIAAIVDSRFLWR